MDLLQLTVFCCRSPLPLVVITVTFLSNILIQHHTLSGNSYAAGRICAWSKVIDKGTKISWLFLAWLKATQSYNYVLCTKWQLYTFMNGFTYRTGSCVKACRPLGNNSIDFYSCRELAFLLTNQTVVFYHGCVYMVANEQLIKPVHVGIAFSMVISKSYKDQTNKNNHWKEVSKQVRRELNA